MERQYTEITSRTPLIVLEEGRIIIMGRSIVENPKKIFASFSQWLDDYVVKGKKKLMIELGFEYINTGSVKWLFVIMRNIPKSLIEGITWYYEEDDEDMKDLGEVLESLIESDFVMKELPLMDEKTYRSIISL